MARTLIIAEIDGMDVTHLNATIDILEEPICMNLGVAFMPFMEDGYYFLKEDYASSMEKAEGLNEVETSFVKYLYKIRKCNRKKEKLSYTTFAGPNAIYERSRVFIGGKIFPTINISYGSRFKGYVGGMGGSDADCTKIEIKNISTYELRALFGETFEQYKKYGLQYISVDNGKIKIFLPPYTEMKINYAHLLYDFLTNGSETKLSATLGEFPDMETYTLATDNSTLKEGCWQKKDRTQKNDTWKKACMYIVEKKYQGVLAPFGQIADFYKLLDDKITSDTKHKTRWLKGAFTLVDALRLFDYGAIRATVDNDVETILCELNVGICDYAITQFYELFYGKYKNNPLNTLEKAYQFDLAFVQHEQGVVAVPIYTNTSKETLRKFQAMADKDPQASLRHGFGGIFGVTPEFDDPWNGEVTDAGFRTDLPMLMLWLDRHKPTSVPFKGKVDGNGFLLEKYKKIIRPYETK